MCWMTRESRIVIKTGVKEPVSALVRVPMGAELPGQLLLRSLHLLDLLFNKLLHCGKTKINKFIHVSITVCL